MANDSYLHDPVVAVHVEIVIAQQLELEDWADVDNSLPIEPLLLFRPEPAEPSDQLVCLEHHDQVDEVGMAQQQ